MKLLKGKAQTPIVETGRALSLQQPFRGLGLALIFCTLFSLSAFSQEKSNGFDRDSVKFLSQVEDYLNTGLASRGDVNDFVKQFAKVWNSPGYNAYYKKITYRVCNEMEVARIPVYPTFQSFLVTMEDFVKADLPQDKFDQWEVCLEKLLKKKPFTNLTNFLAMSENLFTSRVMFKSPTVSWGSNNTDYIFNCDSVMEIIFPALDLKCTNENGDTLVIYGTKGVFNIQKGIWVGTGGRTDWTRTGLDANTVYAELKDYRIFFKEGAFIADSVTFWDKTYFDTPILGKLVEKDISEPKEKETFPRFVSYGKRFTIPNLTPDVTYNGGFSMRGRRFVGSGTREEPAELIFKRNNKPFLIAKAPDYSITKENIMTEDAQVNILLDGDSIYHPDIEFSYNIPKKHVSLIRSDKGLSEAPFFDTYHKVNMFFEELSWFTDQDKMEFKTMEATTQTVGDFESQDFFRPDLYDKLRNSNGESQLGQIARFTKTINSRDMTVDELATEMKVLSDDLYPFLFLIAKIGLINLDVQRNMIHVQDKLFRFMDNYIGKADYDVIDFHSTNPGGDNGVMDLTTNNITLNGISYVILSDSSSVMVYPDHRSMVLHRNREATFAGKVEAGRLTFYGKQFDFDYENFKINMKDADSLRLVATSFTTDEAGRHHLVPVKSVIRHLSGDLLLDKTNNKSGLQPLKQYPILNCDTTTFVYYDKKNIQNGVYKKDNFFFKADPFTIDSINTFSNTRLHFGGTFASADIAPEMRETLRLQPDYSLGFVHTNPADGLSMYNGKGKLYDTLKLSNKGLIGEGKLSYVTSISKSQDFIFFPDSMNAHVSDFEVNEQKTQPEFPEAHGENVYEHWVPKQDSMMVKDIFKPFTCYNKYATFHGVFALSPDLLRGSGRMDLQKAYLTSNDFNFFHHRVAADTADFNLNSIDSSGLAFATNNMKTDIDFEKKEGNFLTNGKGSYVNFIKNQYIAFMDAFKWYMDEGTLETTTQQKQTVTNNAEELQYSGTKFISIEPHQDSLQFIAANAKWNLRTYQIHARQVPFIDVADARIVPDSGQITVLKNAVMVPLVHATITANNVTKYYTLYNADLNITSRKNYSGTGYYDFVDELKHIKPMYFSNIHVDTSHQTVANTVIPDTTDFSFSPHFKFKGSVTLKASNPFLFFNGEMRISHECNDVKISWVKFASQVNPDDIQIPVASQMNENNIPLASSPVLSSADSIHIYPTFLSPIISYGKDAVIVPDSGLLTFDKSTQQYRISNKEKLVEQSLPGNYVSFDTRKCILYGEGKLNMGVNLDMVDLKTVGNITDYITPDTLIANVSMLINFFFSDDAIDKMATDANSFASLTPVDFTSEDIKKNLHELMGKEDADKLITQLTLYGTLKKTPKELQSTLFLTNVRLKWNNDRHSYVSQGPIGVVSVGKNPVNKEATGAIEIRKNRSGGDELTLYLEFDPLHWYFFTYRGGSMQAVSSIDAFNNAITSVKADKTIQKTDKGKYSYNLADAVARRLFLKRISGE